MLRNARSCHLDLRLVVEHVWTSSGAMQSVHGNGVTSPRGVRVRRMTDRKTRQHDRSTELLNHPSERR